MNINILFASLLIVAGLETGCKSTNQASVPEMLPDLTAIDSKDNIMAQVPRRGSLQDDLKELDEHFTLGGRPVQPRALEDVSCWISDKHPGPVAIDMDGTEGSNRYFGNIFRNGDIIGFERERGGGKKISSGSFRYKHIGRLTSGLHVVKTWYDGGGSGTFESLLLLQFTLQNAYDSTGSRNQRIVMQQMGEISLGDRSNTEIKIDGQAVVLKADAKKPERIEFRN